jgi:hypothetical protein
MRARRHISPDNADESKRNLHSLHGNRQIQCPASGHREEDSLYCLWLVTGADPPLLVHYKNVPPMVRATQEAVLRPLLGLTGDEIKTYFLAEEHFKNAQFFPYSVSPLAFLEYDENKILREAGRLGWKTPEDVDSNSTNCLLNSLANIIHRNRHGFHPYASELAKLVREGNMDRSEALAKLKQPESPDTLKLVQKKLGIKGNVLNGRPGGSCI